MKKTITFMIASAILLSPISQVISQDFSAGGPLGATNEAGDFIAMSNNVKVYGSFNFTESCTFDPERNLILSMNRGNDGGTDDGYVSLINPDGSVHTSKWIGATRDGLELRDPIGSAVANGILYTKASGILGIIPLSHNSNQLTGKTFCGTANIKGPRKEYHPVQNLGVISRHIAAVFYSSHPNHD